MPVRVQEPAAPRYLWLATPARCHLNGHEGYRDMFDGVFQMNADSNVKERDVVFFDGGTDVNPALYGEAKHTMTGSPDTLRDEHEQAMFRKAQAAGARCLGTCRGAQFLVVMAGGKLIQHVTGHGGPGHMICTMDGEVLYSESSHHQVMWPFEIPHVLIAWASSNYQQPFKISDEYGKELPEGNSPEIVYLKDTKSLCIQGHAEWVKKDSPFYRFTHTLVREFLFGE